jgi:hypothetical protein
LIPTLFNVTAIGSVLRQLLTLNFPKTLTVV